MLKFIWRTDIHVSDHAPKRRSDDWNEALIKKIKWIGEYAKEINATAVIDGGDFFDVKSPTKNSHKLIQQVIEAHKDYPCPVYANVGNHDCVYGDYSFLPQQPLGVLYSAGIFQRLYDEHEAQFECGGVSVRLCGVPYHGVKYDMGRFNIKKGSEDYLITCAHVLASQKGGDMFEGEDIVKYSDLDEFDTDTWLFGHWHKDQGVFTTKKGKQIVNVGSLSRGSLSQDNLERKPKIVVVSITKEQGIHLEEIVIPHKPASEVFNLKEKQLEQVKDGRIATFVESLKEISNRKAEKGSIRDKVSGLSIEPAVKEKAILLLEQFNVR